MRSMRPTLPIENSMRKKATWSLLILLLLAGAAGAGLVLAVKHEPGFYESAAIAPSAERKERSTDFLKQFTKIANRFVDGQGKWSYTITQEEVNSYFEEDFVRLGDADALGKSGVVAPRIQFDDDHIRIAFRYGSGFWSTIVSYDLRVWLAPKDVNVLVIEILNRQIGGLPVASQTLLNELKELARRRNVDVTWYRNENNPIAVLRLPNSRSRHFAQVLGVEVTPGQLTIMGQCNEPGGQSMLPLDRMLAAWGVRRSTEPQAN